MDRPLDPADLPPLTVDIVVLVAGIVLVVGALVAGLIVSVRLGYWVSQRMTESPEERERRRAEARRSEERRTREDRDDG